MLHPLQLREALTAAAPQAVGSGGEGDHAESLHAGVAPQGEEAAEATEEQAADESMAQEAPQEAVEEAAEELEDDKEVLCFG